MPKKKHQKTTELNFDSIAISNTSAEAFTFGEAREISRNILDYTELSFDGQYYEYPINLSNLNSLQALNPHHTSAMLVKKNIFTSIYIDNKEVPLAELEKAVYDYILFGNAFFEIINERSGKLSYLKQIPAMYVRRGKKVGEYYWLEKSSDYGIAKKFTTNSIIHLKSYDTKQEIYGLPEYLASIHAINLNNEATMFRRKYYLNGAHMGFILYMNSSHIEETDLENIKEQMRNSKGGGNFKNMFLHSPNGKKEDITILPIGEIATKDEFMNVKNVSRDDVLTAHRVPPGLMGIIPTGMSNFGDIDKGAKVFYNNEIKPLQVKFQQINQIIGRNVVNFKDYTETTKNKGNR